MNAPAAQGVHVVEPAAAYSPPAASQFWHSAAVFAANVFENVPFPQSLQLFLPGESWNRPSSQSLHKICSARSWYCPVLQSSHFVLAESPTAYFPVAQLVQDVCPMALWDHPIGQFAHCALDVADTVLEYFPFPQLTQDVCSMVS
jgi:hypothetical protein